MRLRGWIVRAVTQTLMQLRNSDSDAEVLRLAYPGWKWEKYKEGQVEKIGKSYRFSSNHRRRIILHFLPSRRSLGLAAVPTKSGSPSRQHDETQTIPPLTKFKELISSRQAYKLTIMATSNFLDTALYSPTYPLLLRNPLPSDAAAMSQVLSEPKNIEFDPHCSPSGLSPETCSMVITRMRESASEAVPGRVNLMVILLPSVGCRDEGVGEVIGLSGFGGIDEVEGKRFGDVGVMLNPGYRGRGLAVECLRLSMEFAFKELGVHGVTAGCLVRNTPMLTLLERKLGWVGVRTEGEFGENWKGTLSPDEWAQMKARIGW